MKILLIGCFDLYLHPYSEKYINILTENNVDFKFIYWNRLKDNTNGLNEYYIPFNYKMDAYKSIFSKIKGYLKFRKFVKNHINSNKYDKLILLTTQTAFILGKSILKKYINKYIFDYRDVTYEKYLFFKRYVKTVIHNSNTTIMSSPGFITEFNEHKDRIVVMHNDKAYFNNEELGTTTSNCIRISFWGMIRQPMYYKKIFSVFGNDKRFQLDLYGEGYDQVLKDEIQKKEYNNIQIHGRYIQREIIDFAKKTDVLLNSYSNESIQKQALTVKMYEGIAFKIPMIIQKNSFMDSYLNAFDYCHFSIDFDNCNDAEFIKLTIIKNLNEYKERIKMNNEIINTIKTENCVALQKISNFILGD